MSITPPPAGAPLRVDSFELDLVNAKAVSNTNFNTFAQLSTRYGGGSRSSSGAQNDEVVLRLPTPLRGGTWTLVLLHSATTNRGIYSIAGSINGTTWTDIDTTNFDGYAASLTQTRKEQAGLTIVDGTAFIRLKMATKNNVAPSSAYNAEVSGLAGLRTGA